MLSQQVSNNRLNPKTDSLPADSGYSTLLQNVSLAVGLILGGTSALLLVFLIIIATPVLDLPALLSSWQHILPATWYAFLLEQAQLMGFPLQAETSAYWYMSRTAGLLGYFFIWGSTAWGLLLSTKLVKSILPAPLTFSLHELLSWLGLGFAAFHAFILLGDSYIQFSLADIFLPFAGNYKPLLVGLGSVSLYLCFLIIASFYLKKAIGQKMWRMLHYSTFLLYIMILVHSLLLGSDSGLNLIQMMYYGSAGSIIFLLNYRLLS